MPTLETETPPMMSTGFHPLCEIFPLMTGVPFDELVKDIMENGLREPIWLHDGKIIDGRNRFRACTLAVVKPQYREWDGQGDLTKFVISLNLHRRHLTESQRAMVAAKLANRPVGGDRHSESFKARIQDLNPTIGEAADLLNVSKDSVSGAKAIRRDGAPEIIEAVESGELSLRAARQIIAEPRDEQLEVLEARRQCKPHNSKSNGIVPQTKNHAGRKAPEAIRGAIGTLVGLASGLDSFAAADAAPTAEEAEQWEKDLSAVISAINRFRRQLKELAHV